MAKQVVREWISPASVRIEMDGDRAMTAADLDGDVTFAIVVVRSDGSESRIDVYGGNGGAYGASAEITDSPG